MDILDNLNEAQKEAVLQTEGPVMVSAGAGSGKTRVLTRRVAHIIKDLNVSPFNVLALTFTNKAAREMKERISSLIGFDVSKMWISTFHSFCAKILRMEINCLDGYNNKFVIIDDDDSQKILKDIYKEIGITDDDFKIKKARNLISMEKNYETVVLERDKDKRLFQTIKNNYELKLKADNLLDFDDLLLKTIEVFENNKEALDSYQEKFKYILVDEYQDTNLVQYKLIRMLGAKYKNVFVVGDEDQSIYSFRGAKIENIEAFKRDYPDFKLILLEENYRSTNKILEIANEVISKNSYRSKKKLFSSNSSELKPVYYHANSTFDEGLFISGEIKKLIQKGYKYSDIAVFYRSNYLSKNYEDVLRKEDIPYVVYGNVSFYERKEIKDIVGYLRLIINHNDDFSFKRVVNEPKRKIGEAVISKLSAIAVEKNISLFEAIDFIEAKGIGYNNLILFKFTILELEEYLMDETNKLEDIIDQILEKTGYKEALLGSNDNGDDRLENILELKNDIMKTDAISDGTKKDKLTEIINNITLMTNLDHNDDSDSVSLMTYHQAKGLEFKAVFMPALEEGIFPTFSSVMEENGEEERRVCYVGITRAMERIYFTNSSNRFLFGKNQTEEPSRYILDMDINKLDTLGKIQTTMKINREKVIYPDTDMKPGDKVTHERFGNGLVVGITESGVQVAFKAEFGIKVIAKGHPSLKKME